MKITKVTPIHADHYAYAAVETDAVLTGLGEVAIWGHQPAVNGAVGTFADYLAGMPVVMDGFAGIPTDPGLGIRLNRDRALATKPHRRDITMRPHRDGFVVNQ